MPSLIEELQRDALDKKVSVTELLQKCLLVATKLGIKEPAEWVRLELDGYPDTKVPKYRDVGGQPEVFNPYHGYQPIQFEDPQHRDNLSLMHFNQRISEIEYHLQQCQIQKSSSIHVSYPAVVERMLQESMELPLTPSLRINAAELNKIVEAVRRLVLEWSLRLETDGIKGDGMSFSLQEKEKAQSTTYHIENYIHGNVQGSQFQVGTQNSAQHNVSNSIDITQLREIISLLKDAAPQLGLENNKNLELGAEIQTLQAQVESPRPKHSIISQSLTAVRTILEEATGHVLAAALLHRIGLLLG